MQKNTVFLIHGYAEKDESFQTWKSKLEARGYNVKVLGYTSLSDEVTLKDIAEGFERALHLPGRTSKNYILHLCNGHPCPFQKLGRARMPLASS